MPTRYAPWRQRLQAIEAAGQTRRLRTLTPTGPTTGLLGGREVVVACSNDYLGLAWHPNVRAAATGGGSGSSRLISGDRRAHRELEEAVESWLGMPTTLFTSGWHANTGLFPAILEKGDKVVSDALNHASIIDGLRLSKATRVIAPHAQPQHIPADARAVVVEGLFSMDGDVPDLTRYPANPWLVVDEAHALGCLGPQGRGAAAAQGRVPDIIVGTFGKAFGAHGAFIAGPPELKALLINAARSFIFTTGPAEPVMAMALAGLRQALAEPERQTRLAANSRAFRAGLTERGWTPLGAHHIVPVVVGANVMQVDARLQNAGVFAAGIRFPTVAEGQERIRFTLSSEHTPLQLERILDAMGTPT